MNVATLKVAVKTKEIDIWFKSNGWKPHAFQKAAWKAYLKGKNGLVNAPTGSGKTYSILAPIAQEAITSSKKTGFRAIWITPIRALSKEIEISAKRLFEGLNAEWSVGIRTGDTSPAEKKAQIKNPPEFLITTPETLHILLSQKKHLRLFKNLDALVVDEWHELIGSKRGVQVELALSRLRSYSAKIRVWGISATIGNLVEAMEVLVGPSHAPDAVLIKSNIKKKIKVQSLMPRKIEKLPWVGHIGITLLDKVVKIINDHTSTLIFTNTRAQAEIWYHNILKEYPDMAGQMAMHHSSIAKELRYWVEDALYEGKLKAVVCTSSLDLGVDFRPVEAIVQVGGPKGVARFVQRAGRSGHQPGATSKIFFLPTHAIELIEAAALRQATKDGYLEEQQPLFRSFDVLIQYLCTLAVGDGFVADEVIGQIVDTFSYQSISPEEWDWCLRFITSGGKSLKAYDTYNKVDLEDGLFKITKSYIARRHRLSIGTIVGDNMLLVKYVRGSSIGFVEEYFVSSMNPGDVFWFAGRPLEFVRLKDMTVEVKKTKKKSGKIPAWQGGRLSLSSNMSEMLRQKIHEYCLGECKDPEMKKIDPILKLQSEISHLPMMNEILIEQHTSEEGHHLFIYPFEGRMVHEGMASLFSYRISKIKPMSFSLAYNDYGFELLSDQEIPLSEAFDEGLFSLDNLMEDIEAGINSTEMARRRFRDIAVISGLVFQGFPGAYIKDRHLQSNSSLLFNVFTDYDSENLLLRQAYNEMIDYQLELVRFRETMKRLNGQKLVITYPKRPTPLSMPIMLDRLRERMSNESMEDRIKRMNLSSD